MRLRDCQFILNKAIPKLAIVMTSENYPGGVGSRIKGLASVREGLAELRGIPGLRQRVDQILSHQFISVAVAENPLFEANAAQGFASTLATLRDDVLRLKAVVDAIVTEEPSDAVSIQFPPTKDLHALAKYSAEFAKVLDQVLLTTQLGHYEIAGFDIGSFDVSIQLDSTAAVAIVVALAQIAREYIQYKLATNRKKEQAKAAAKNEKEPTDEGQIDRIFALTVKQHLAELLGSVAPHVTDQESRNRLQAATIGMAELIEAGAEVKPSLNAPAGLGEKAKEIAAQAPPAPKQLAAPKQTDQNKAPKDVNE